MRHFVSGEAGRLAFEGVVQGPGQWGLALGELTARGPAPLLVLQRLGGGEATYALNYDSGWAGLKPELAPGIKSIRLSAAGVLEPARAAEADWSLRVSGGEGTHLSAATDDGELVYEGSFALERPIAEGLSVLYAVDAKRRADGGSLAPGWVRQGLGLRAATRLGSVKLNAFQSPDAPTGKNVVAVYSGDLARIALREVPGSPSFSFGVGPNPDSEDLMCVGSLKVAGPAGVAGNLHLRARKDAEADSRWIVDRRLHLSRSLQVREGLSLSAAAQVLGAPEAAVPLEIKVGADLSALAGRLLNEGSELAVVARCTLRGEERPAASARLALDAKPVGPLKVSAAGRLSEGGVAGKLRATANVADVATSYTVSKLPGKAPSHVASAVWPSGEKDGGSMPQVHGRVTKGGQDNDGRARLQLGMYYDLNKGPAKIRGASNLLDTGEQLVDDEGMPWPSTMFSQAQMRADAVRRGVREGLGEGIAWLLRHG